MEWPIILVIILIVPIILIPIAFIWYLNIGGIIAVINERKKVTAARWLFEFERKGSIGWERQDSEFKQYYIEQIDRFIDQFKYKLH